MRDETNTTPGPWFVNGSNAIKIGEFTYRPHWLGVANPSEMEANARLIAAAPDLLQMLKVAQLWLDVDGRYDMQGINAAIAKAEGRSK